LLVHPVLGVRNRDEAIVAEAGGAGGVWEGGDEASQEEFWVGLEFLMAWINGFDEILGDC
jgi:hypothetical protein